MCCHLLTFYLTDIWKRWCLRCWKLLSEPLGTWGCIKRQTRQNKQLNLPRSPGAGGAWGGSWCDWCPWQRPPWGCQSMGGLVCNSLPGKGGLGNSWGSEMPPLPSQSAEKGWSLQSISQSLFQQVLEGQVTFWRSWEDSQLHFWIWDLTQTSTL